MLALVLNWLGSGVLQNVLKHLEARKALENDAKKMQTEITISEIKAELAVRQEQAAIVKLQLGHPIAWAPRFLIEMSVAIYFMAHVVDSIWNLSGDVRPLGVPEAALMATAVSAMFLKATFGDRK
jgi:hypothetical protein